MNYAGRKVEMLKTVELSEGMFCLLDDESPENPRDWYNLGSMVCFHKRYSLGDKHTYNSAHYDNWQELHDAIIEDEGPCIILPLYLFDHSGISITTDAESFRMWDSAAWDWGQIGFIYVSYRTLGQEYGWKRITKKRRETVANRLKAEVQIYNYYLEGEVYGYKLTDKAGELVDSCFGFYGPIKESGILDYFNEIDKSAIVEAF